MNSSQTLNVLLVEDSEEDAALVLLALKKGGWALRTDRVDSAAGLIKALEAGSWDLILSDYSMPGFDGITALRMVKEMGVDIPMILISGTIGEDVAVSAMKAGANDYLMKDNLHRLVPAVERELREYQNRRNREEELRFSELKLRQAQKMEIVGRLSGGIVHDFNNLLAVILGNVDLLQEKLKTLPDSHPEVTGIEKAALHASSLVRQLLAFSRKQALQPKTFDMHAALQEIQPMLQLMVGDSVVVKVEFAGQAPVVRMDRVQLEQMLLNLASNARDAMRKTGILTIRTAIRNFPQEDLPKEENLKPGPYAVLSVGDNGCGMSQATLVSIFEPFFTTKEEGKGTGLGLSTTLDIARQSGGWIGVDSAPGQGTTFHIHFPNLNTEIKASPAKDTAAKPLGKGQKIVVVEDNNELRKLTREVLLIGGYEVCACADYEELEEALHSGFMPEVLLSDLKIPGQKSRSSLPDLLLKHPEWRVICMSGYTSDEALRMGLAQGEFTFLEKPFTPSKLLRTIEEVMAAKPAASR